MMAHATPIAWGPRLQHVQYGTDETYARAAAWLSDCAVVADWGGGSGIFRQWLPLGTDYRLIDGTVTTTTQTLADLARYRAHSDGILLRHVLDCTFDWRAVLRNALLACRRRMVVVTFTPDSAESHIQKMKSGWPVWSFNPDDLRAEMGAWLVREDCVQTSHPERVYYLERPV